MSDVLVVGADISVRHSALVVADQGGKVVAVRYLCAKVKNAKKALGGTRCTPKTSKDVDGPTYEIRRLIWLRDYYERLTTEVAEIAVGLGVESVHVGIEDYAYRAEMKAHQIGEASGVFRLACKDLGFMLRLHDPSSVKMFATGRGNASKEEVQEGAIAKWGDQFEAQKYPEETGDGIRGDVADAFTLLMMTKTELDLRAGRVALGDLPKEELRIFNRITKKYPVNLLERPWL